MKKLLVLLLILIFVPFTITACCKKASDKAITVAKSAVDIADGYLDYEITYSEASNAIDELQEDMEYVDNLAQNDKNKAKDFGISTDLLSLSSSLLIDDYQDTSESYDKVVEARNRLAEDAGLKNR